MRGLLKYFYYLLIPGCFTGCRRYLDVKADSALLTPLTADDLILLLNNELLNQSPVSLHPGTDEFYFTDADWQNADSFIRQAYIWSPDAQQASQETGDWSNLYTSVQYANTVLYELDRIKQVSPEQYDRIKGSALFFRSFIFYQLLQVFAPAYDPQTAEEEPGIALRLTSDVNEPSVRSSLADGYKQIEKDLLAARLLLRPSFIPDNKPDAAAASALLARLYLITGNYLQARDYAGEALALKGGPADFNTFQSNADYRAQMIRQEMIFYSVSPYYSTSLVSLAKIDTTLYRSYVEADLRRYFYFDQRSDGSHRYRGGFAPNSLFNGITTGEACLIRAEANARLGETGKALEDLNYLLSRRYTAGHFVPYTSSVRGEALSLILGERKKELLFHGTRWTDIRRLNFEPFYRRTLTRSLQGKTYQLPPGDPRFAYLLPLEVVRLTGMPQNKR